MLALALGLIAVAPYVFHAASDGVDIFEPNRRFGIIGGRRIETNGRVLHVRMWLFSTQYYSAQEYSLLGLRGPRGPYQIALPPESITLRVACAVALAFAWLLVLGGRLLARRWMRKNPSSVAA